MVTCRNGYEYTGLSTDTKPTDINENGATFLEMDTGSVYIFNAASNAWIKLSGE